MANNVDVGLKFKTTYEGLDAGKKDLKELKDLMDSIGKDGVKLNLKDGEIEQAKLQISALERSIREAEQSGGDFGRIFQSNLNTVQNEAKQTATSVSRVEKEIKSLNQTSSNGGGFKSISNAARLATKEIQGTTGQIDQLRINLQQGLGQTIAFGAIGAVTGAVTDALNVTKQLDEISTDISIVSGKTRKEMEGYRDAAIGAADALGTTTKDYLKASLIFEQQGGQAAYYAKELAEATVTAANISNVATDQMSEYLTATINGFQLLKEKGGEAGTYITDVMAKLGAASGSDLAEIATGLTRTANTAKDVGFQFEEIATMIATVSEVTRQAPESVGNAFKSMLTSFTQLREAGEEEVEAFTNKVQQAFQLGGIEDISLFDNGNLRDAADIFKDIAARWQTMNKEQQSLVSEAVAGKYQAETFRAFMNNQERYTELLDEAYNSAGTSAQQQLVYMDSLKAKGEQLENAWQGAVNKVVDSDMFKGVLEDATNFLKIIGDAKTGLGGLATAIAPIVGIGGQLFGASQVGEMFSNHQLNKQAREITKDMENLRVAQEGNITALQEEYRAAARVNEVMSTLGPDAAKNYEAITKEIVKLDERLKEIPKTAEEVKQKAAEAANMLQANGNYPGVDEKNVTRAANRLKDNQDPRLQENINQLTAAQKTLQAAQQTTIDQLSAISKTTSVLNSSASTKIKTLRNELISWQNDYQGDVHNSKALEERFGETIKNINNDINKQSNNYSKLLTVRERAKNIEQEIKTIIDAERKAAEQQVAHAKEQVVNAEKALTIKSKELVLEGQYSQQMSEQDKIIADRNVLQNRVEGTDKIVKKTNLLTKGVRGLSLAYSTIVPAIGAFNAAQDGTISKQDAVIAGLQNTAGMLLTSPNLYAMAAGAAVGALSLVVDKFDLFKSRAEKAKESNEALVKTFMSLQESVSSSLSNLSDVSDIYKRFEGVNAEDFINNTPDPSDTEAMEKYNKNLEDYDNLASKLAQTNPELVKGYDDTGRAIIDLSKNFDDLVAAQKKAQTSNYQMLAGNRDSFIVQNISDVKDAKKQLDEYTTKIVALKKELAEAKSQSNSGKTDNILNEIMEAQNKIAEAKKDFNDTKANIQSNIVVPFNEANEAFNDLIKKSPELKTTFEHFSDAYMNSDLLSGLASEGDEQGMQNLLQNMNLIKDKFTEIAEEDPEKAKQFLNGITESSEWAKTALYEVQGNIDTLQEHLNQASNSALADTQSEGLKFIDKILPEKDVEEVQKRVGKMASDIKTETEKLNSTNFLDPKGITDFQNQDLAMTKDASRENDKIKEYHELQQAMIKVSDQYAKSTKTAKGFNEALGDVQSLDRATDALKNLQQNGFDDTQLEALKAEFPEFANTLQQSAEKGTDAFTTSAGNLYEYLSERQNAAVTGMMETNSQFYTSWQLNNSDVIGKISDEYGIDASNYQNLSEYKTALEQLSLEDLQTIAGDAIQTNADKNAEIEKAEAKHFTNMISYGDIWSNSNLTFSQKMAASFLNTFDDIYNGLVQVLADMSQAILDLLNWIHKTAGDVLGGLFDGLIPKNIQKKLGLDKVKDWGEGGAPATVLNKLPSSTFGKDYMDKKNKEAKDREDKKNELINQIAYGQFKNENAESNVDIFKKTGLNKPKNQDSTKNSPKDADNHEPNKDDPIQKESKDKDKKEVQDLDLELNRYYKLDHILSQIEKRYSELADAKDAAYGNDRLAIMKQEEQLLAQKAATLKQYNSALSQEQAELRKQLSDNGFTFDQSGEIANLNERLKAMQNNANSKDGDAKEDAIA